MTIRSSIKDAWSRDFSTPQARDYVYKCTGKLPTYELVRSVYAEMNKQFDEWCANG